ncbi:MAG TPA: sialidase family protein [Noviherbaspirillum sp.]|nr:sialidase family protein [Noviherbaspirillum sp.]
MFLLIVSAPLAAVPIRWGEVVEVDTGAGVRGPWQQNRSHYNYIDDGSAALDAKGEAAVVWVDQARKQVLFQRYRLEGDGTAGLARPTVVSDSPEVFSWMPRVALAPDVPGRIYVLWQDIIFSGGSHGGDIMFARSDDGGATFSEPLNLSDSSTGAGKGRITRDHWHNGSFDLVAAPGGAVHVAWTEFEGRLLYARSLDGGASFAQPLRVAGSDSAPARGPTLAAGPEGRIYLAWTVGEARGADIHVARSLDGGASFEPARPAARTGAYSDAPKLALDRRGVLHLAFAESAAGPFDRFRVHYARSTDGGLSFETPREISTPVPEGAISAHFPHLAVDGAGNPVVAWELHPQRVARPRGMGIAVSLDGGETFSAPAAVPHSADPGGGPNGSQQGLLMRKLAVGPDGRLVIAQSALRENEFSRVWLIHGRLDRRAGGTETGAAAFATTGE